MLAGVSVQSLRQAVIKVSDYLCSHPKFDWGRITSKPPLTAQFFLVVWLSLRISWAAGQRPPSTPRATPRFLPWRIVFHDCFFPQSQQESEIKAGVEGRRERKGGKGDREGGTPTRMLKLMWLESHIWRTVVFSWLEARCPFLHTWGESIAQGVKPRTGSGGVAGATWRVCQQEVQV